MKKVFLSAALVLAVVGSWAFYPKTAAPAGNVMVIGRMMLFGSATASLVTIGADGTVSEAIIEAKRSTKSKLNESFNDLHRAELLKVNQLQTEGYRLTSTTATGVQTSQSGGVMETIYQLSR